MSIPRQIEDQFERCSKCKGTGRCWWYELDGCAGHDPGDCTVDDTLYTCDQCGGTGNVKKD